MPRVRHVMVPEVRYNYVQDRDQESLPFFDFNDRIVHENRVVYSLTNYLTGRFSRGDDPPEYRDIFYFRIAQGYEFSGTRRDLLTLVDEKRPFTDVQVEATVHPHRQVSLSTDLRYNPYRTLLSTVAVSANAHDGKGNAAGIVYRHARDEVEYLEARTSVAILSPVFLNYANRYSFDRKGTLESYYSLEYRHQCWSVSFSYRDRPDTKEFFVTFALAGIGSVGKIRAF
jgi:LPS-assembly protein